MRSNALRTAQHNTARPVRPVASRVRGPKNRYHRNSQRRREMQRPSIAANKNPRPPRQRNQFRNRKTHRPSRSRTGRLRHARQLFFARTIIENRIDTPIRQLLRNFTVALRRPPLRSPARARIQNRKIADAMFRKPLSNTLFRLRIARKVARNTRWQYFPVIFKQRLRNRKILLDDMTTMRDYFPRVPQTRGCLARLRCSIPLPTTRPQPPPTAPAALTVSPPANPEPRDNAHPECRSKP